MRTSWHGKDQNVVERMVLCPNIVKKIVDYCRVCQLDKVRSQNRRLYSPFTVPEISWEVVRMDFILELHMTRRKNYYVMVVVDPFSKMELLSHKL
jgi:hypothetical protein